LKHEYNLKIFGFWLFLLQVHAGRGKVFQICGIVALFLLIVILPVLAAGIAPVISMGVTPDTQRGQFTLPSEPGGY
jgi:hypothetical protein